MLSLQELVSRADMHHAKQELHRTIRTNGRPSCEEGRVEQSETNAGRGSKLGPRK
jgi:hypothetical protein